MALVSAPSSVERTIFRRIRYPLTLLSFIAAILTIFLILSCKDASGQKYSRLILASLVVSLLSEMYLQLVLDPVFLFPSPCVSRDEPIFDIPVRSSIQHIIFLLLYEFNSPLIITSFIHRHQAVMVPGSRWLFSPRVQMIPPLIVVPTLIMFPTILLSYTKPPGTVYQYAEILANVWPSKVIARADCYNPDIFAGLCVWGVVCCVCFVICVILIVAHTFASLRKHAAISEKMREYHITMTRVLVLQSVIPVVFVIAPYSFATTVFLLEMSHSLIIPTCTTIISAHTFVHSVVVVATTPVYRRQILSILRKQEVIRMRVNSLSSEKK